jgi:hypothetical protein
MNKILYLTPITMDCLHISAKTNQKFTCGTPLTANRTPNRTAIRTQNHACRRPLTNLNDWKRANDKPQTSSHRCHSCLGCRRRLPRPAPWPTCPCQPTSSAAPRFWSAIHQFLRILVLLPVSIVPYVVMTICSIKKKEDKFFFYWTWSFVFLNGFYNCFLRGPM